MTGMASSSPQTSHILPQNKAPIQRGNAVPALAARGSRSRLALRYARMELGLRNKIAMVGGASKGLGYAVARALAADGAQVSVAARDRAAVERAAGTLSRETGSPVFAVAADLSKPDAIAHWHAATVERFGGVDLLFA